MNGSARGSNKTVGVEVGDCAPDFVLITETGKKWRLCEHLGHVTTLLFYPRSETLMCTRQMCSVRDNWAAYLQTKAVVVGISSGTADEHNRFSRNHRLPLTLLTDTNNEITKLYAQHRFMSVRLTRAIIVIDAKGNVRYRKVMLRAFRPSDKSVLTAIYAARTDLLHENFKHLLEESRERNRFFSS